MGGKADTGLGERDEDEDEEEEDTGHSRGFMSWRLRQNVATCSVLCKRSRQGSVSRHGRVISALES